VAIEQHATRRRQRQLAHVVVVRHVPELLVLSDLKDPESDCQQRERDGNRALQHAKPVPQVAPIVRH
jgi:hypothetical protein